jgi:hypothetical protein
VPLQGETLQGRFPCGCSVFAEQVSHHPPVSCWQVLDHDGQVRGTQARPAGGRQLSNGSACSSSFFCEQLGTWWG